jgi:hypothetical protein
MVLMVGILRYFERGRMDDCGPPPPEEISMKRSLAAASLVSFASLAWNRVAVDDRFLGISIFALAYLGLALLAAAMLFARPRSL